MSPRSILKGSQHPTLAKLPPPPVLTNPFPFSSCVVLSPHVRFAPTPTLTSIYTVDQDYDRAPISISPNACVMPHRGERVYQSNSPQYHHRGRSAQFKGSYFHPRAFEACTPEHGPRSASPLLSPPTPELTFSSDSSDSDSSLPTSPISPAELGAGMGPSSHCRMFTPGPIVPGYDVDHSRLPSTDQISFNRGRPRTKRPNTLISDNVRTPVSESVVSKRRRSIPSSTVPNIDQFSLSHIDSSCLGGF